jgi:hypothetical protein
VFDQQEAYCDLTLNKIVEDVFMPMKTLVFSRVKVLGFRTFCRSDVLAELQHVRLSRRIRSCQYLRWRFATTWPALSGTSGPTGPEQDRPVTHDAEFIPVVQIGIGQRISFFSSSSITFSSPILANAAFFVSGSARSEFSISDIRLLSSDFL